MHNVSYSDGRRETTCSRFRCNHVIRVEDFVLVERISPEGEDRTEMTYVFLSPDEKIYHSAGCIPPGVSIHSYTKKEHGPRPYIQGTFKP